MPLPLVTSDELAAIAWIASIPGFSAAMVGPTLPPDADASGNPSPWVATGYVTVAIAGGNPDADLPVSRPVLDVQCWATDPGSNRPPWLMAFAIAGAITRATLDRTTLNRTLTPAVNGVTYPQASVQGARVLTAFRRLYADAADFAVVSGDLWLSWIAPAEQIP